MIKMKSIFATVLLAGSLAFAGMPGAASEAGTVETELQSWSFAGIFGRYDQNQLRRGFQVFQEVCASCHGAKYLAFRNLSEPGGPEYSPEQVKLLAAEYFIIDADAEDGERPGIPADRWPEPFESERDARDVNSGAFPPDFSVLAKARGVHKPFPMWIFDYFTAYQEGGSDYIYNLLINYHDEAPEGVEISDEQYYNAYFAGNAISMASPLFDELVEYEGDGVPLTTEQYARDVSAFMMWLADPHLNSRKSTGFKVLLFLVVFASMMFLVKRKVWSKVKH